MFKLIDKNNPPNTIYTLTPEAHSEFIHLHDTINQRIHAEHPYDHDRKSILSKAHGQLLRLSATQLNIDQALSILEQDNEDIEWNYQISKEILIKSAAFLEYFISQKFALCNPPHAQGNFGITDANNYDWHRIRRILELPNSTITPFMISQAHIQQRTNGRYRREDAVKLMEDIEELQLGLIEQTSGMGRPTKLLRK